MLCTAPQPESVRGGLAVTCSSNNAAEVLWLGFLHHKTCGCGAVLWLKALAAAYELFVYCLYYTKQET